jgi:hypothetical protein
MHENIHRALPGHAGGASLTQRRLFARARTTPSTRKRGAQCNSERVPNKNFRDLCGKPLYAWTLSALLSVTRIERVVINTDSTTLEDEIRALFPDDAHRVQARSLFVARAHTPAAPRAPHAHWRAVCVQHHGTAPPSAATHVHPKHARQRCRAR